MSGIQYENKVPDFSTTLRYKYGKCKEEVSTFKRNKNPYTPILSANILIKKEAFLTCNYLG